ncbi:MAG: hypothetical protein DI590_14365 [Methylorubrum populi]|nr:hypothetical protein AX289_06975 [Methylorubrum populi]PZP69101.1 MAG: hypothetical protein DI590_14365 [Methylorubrum populi]
MIVVSRDRTGLYVEAARTGAPTATQAADHWHLLVNASEAPRGIVELQQSEIRDMAYRVVHTLSNSGNATEMMSTSKVHSPRRDRCETALWLSCIVRYDVAWRTMPRDLPPWHAVCDQAQRWLRAFCFERLVHHLRAVLRLAAGRPEEPSAVVLDSRTLRSTSEIGTRAA